MKKMALIMATAPLWVACQNSSNFGSGSGSSPASPSVEASSQNAKQGVWVKKELVDQMETHGKVVFCGDYQIPGLDVFVVDNVLQITGTDRSVLGKINADQSVSARHILAPKVFTAVNQQDNKLVATYNGEDGVKSTVYVRSSAEEATQIVSSKKACEDQLAADKAAGVAPRNEIHAQNLAVLAKHDLQLKVAEATGEGTPSMYVAAYYGVPALTGASYLGHEAYKTYQNTKIARVKLKAINVEEKGLKASERAAAKAAKAAQKAGTAATTEVAEGVVKVDGITIVDENVVTPTETVEPADMKTMEEHLAEQKSTVETPAAATEEAAKKGKIRTATDYTTQKLKNGVAAAKNGTKAAADKVGSATKGAYATATSPFRATASPLAELRQMERTALKAELKPAYKSLGKKAAFVAAAGAALYVGRQVYLAKTDNVTGLVEANGLAELIALDDEDFRIAIEENPTYADLVIETQQQIAQ